MKKILFKLLSFVFTLGSFFMLTLDNVKAEKVTIKLDYQSNVYYTRKGAGFNESHQYLYYSLNGVPAFCIEPGAPINDWDYITGDISKSPFNDEITNQMVLIGHYGYDYPGHQTQKYRMATQALIWETAKNGLKVEYYTKANAGGNYIDISAERNEIMRLVNSHYDKPSFNGTNYDATLKKEIVVEDTSNILSDFKVLDDGGNNVTIDGNKLHIIPNSFDKTTITLEKKKYDTKTTIIYTGENGKSQKLGRFRYDDPVNAFITLNTTGGAVSIEKVDSETTTPQGDAKLSGAVYGVYDESDNLVTQVTTDNNGKATSSLLNKLGTFYLKEITASNGYLLDDTKYTFEIKEDNLNPLIKVKENVIKGKIKVNKLDADTNACNSQGKANLVGAKYGIYNSSNKLIETLTINDDCTAISSNLPYGNYKVLETSAGVGYYLDKTSYNANITQDGTTTEITSKDSVIKAKIKVTKVDSETNSCKAQGDAKLSGAIYKIYDENNNIVDTLTIGNDCTALSKELPYGEYTIKEDMASVGYKIDSNTYDANIVNSNTINITSKEEVVKGTIKVFKFDSETNSCKAQGDATLVGAKFEIKDKNNKVVETLTIGDDCTALSKELPYGEYTITEKESPKGYYLNKNTFNVSIKEQVAPIQLRAINSNNYEVIVHDDVIKNDFIFNKFYGNESTGFIYSEPNATFNIIDSKNEVFKSFTTDENGYAKVTLPHGNYKVKQIKGLEEYKLMGTFDISVNEDSNLTQIKNIKNGEITARLKLYKIDAETKKNINIAGFKFKIKNTKTNEYVCQTTNKVVCEYETNEEGILLTPLPLFAGDYEIEEIKAMPNYLISNGKINFSIRDNDKILFDETYGSIVEVHYENKAVKGKIDITKYGEKFIIDNANFHYDKDLLDDVSFKLYADGDIKLQDGTIKYKDKDTVKDFKTKDGKYTIDNLPLGKYCLMETATNNKYLLDDKVHCFELKYKDDKTPVIEYKLELNNYLKKSNLEFTKTDLVKGTPIPNTKMEFYTSDNELIYSGITDKNGKITIPDLPIGKYYIKEKEATTGYLLSDEIVYFEIKENGEIIKANMTNKKITGNLEISKTDISTDEPLPNTLFEVYDSNDKLIISKRTDDKGKIVIKDLEYGNYYFLEKEAPEGYVLNDEKMYFSIKEDGKTIKSNVKDKKITGTLEITKLNVSTSEPLPNTLFEIYDAKTDELLFSERTDDKGQVIIPNLVYGDYYAMESEAPEGYILNDEKMYFSIKEDGQVVKATFTDEKIIVEVPKTALNDSIVLDIVAFALIVAGIGYVIYDKKKNK